MERLIPFARDGVPVSSVDVRAGNEGARTFVELFSRAAPHAFIANLKTRMEAVNVAGWQLPLSSNDGDEGKNCYLCSPRAQYVDYAAYELSRLGHPLAELPLRGLLAAADKLFERAALDRTVIVNNWLLSTNLYPSGWHGAGLPDLIARLRELYRGHAILFRSINARQNPELLPALRRAGARLLASRVVWHYAGTGAKFTRTTDYRRDVRLLQNGQWKLVGPDDLCASDLRDFARLYEQLYIEKYTALNPRYTARFLTACHENRFLRFQGLRDRENGRWLGVLGLFERDGVLTAPIVGYDTGLPAKLGLYRALMALVLRETAEHELLLNLSAGAGSFKRLRGGEPCVEYTAVFDAHLSPKQRWAWKILAELSNRAAMPLAWRLEVRR